MRKKSVKKKIPRFPSLLFAPVRSKVNHKVTPRSDRIRAMIANFSSGCVVSVATPWSVESPTAEIVSRSRRGVVSLARLRSVRGVVSMAKSWSIEPTLARRVSGGLRGVVLMATTLSHCDLYFKDAMLHKLLFTGDYLGSIYPTCIKNEVTGTCIHWSGANVIVE